jgi:YVTN family beta-propeller protein
VKPTSLKIPLIAGLILSACFVSTFSRAAESLLYDGEKGIVTEEGEIFSRIRALYVTTGSEDIRTFRAKSHSPMYVFSPRKKYVSVAASRDGERVYAVSKNGPVSCFYTVLNSFDTIVDLGPGQWSYLSLSPDGRWLYVLDSQRDVMDIVDLQNKKVAAEVNTGSMPVRCAFSPDGKIVMVVERLAKTIAGYDAMTGIKKFSYAAGQSPFGISVSSAGERIYVTDTASNALLVLSASDGSLLHQARLGMSPKDLAQSADGKTIAVSNSGGDTVTLLKTDSQGNPSIIEELKVGAKPAGVVFTPEGDKLYVVSEGTGKLYLMQIGVDKPLEEISCGLLPSQLVLSAPQKT